MEEFILTILDSTGIQNYIFGSNKLKENIGASYLVEQWSKEWVYEALQQVTPDAHNLTKKGNIQEQPLEANPTQQVEVIYRGGGNVVLMSRSEETAKTVVARLSRHMLLSAPGLEIAATHRNLKANEAIGGENGAYNALMDAHNQTKQQRQRSVPLLGLGVTLACRATGLPAVDFDKEEERAISSEVKAKLRAVDRANQRLRGELGDVTEGFSFSGDFDDFGRSRDESSYIAVLHADGNGMGKRFEQLTEQFTEAQQNRDCLNALRSLSKAVEASGRAALNVTMRQLVESFSTHGTSELDERMKRFCQRLPQHKTEKMPIFPVRPLVFGGDDLTLVCDGRLGLPLAAVYLRAFHEQTKQLFAALDLPVIDEETRRMLHAPAHACAGIVIVKAHYPFARAYDLSSTLCDNAKALLRRKNRRDTAAIDWHFTSTGISADLSDLRKRHYRGDQGGDLTMRPVTLDAPGVEQSWRHWGALRELIETFVNDEAWSERHNKVIALREALRSEGNAEVRRFLTNYRIGLLPNLPAGNKTLRERGWDGDRCAYFDAIEALEFYLPVEPVAVEETV